MSTNERIMDRETEKSQSVLADDGTADTDDRDLMRRILSAEQSLSAFMSRPGSAPTRPAHGASMPLVEQILDTTAEVESFLTEQSARIAYLENLTLTDELTGLRNRRGFNECLRRSLAATTRYGDKGALVFCDLDGFKDINDNFGHHVGDIVLRQVARVIESHVRETDIVARLGGDEFAVIMVQTNWRDGLKRAEMLNHVMNRTIVTYDGLKIPISASFGVEPFGPSDTEDKLVARADMAMYVNKRKKNAVTD